MEGPPGRPSWRGSFLQGEEACLETVGGRDWLDGRHGGPGCVSQRGRQRWREEEAGMAMFFVKNKNPDLVLSKCALQQGCGVTGHARRQSSGIRGEGRAG